MTWAFKLVERPDFVGKHAEFLSALAETAYNLKALLVTDEPAAANIMAYVQPLLRKKGLRARSAKTADGGLLMWAESLDK